MRKAPEPQVPLQRDLDPLAAGAVEQDAWRCAAESCLPGLVEVDARARGRPPARCRLPQVDRLADGPERLDRALVHREVGVGDDELGVHLHARAEARALGAHPLRRVEGEELRRRLGEGDAAVVAGAVLGEDDVGLALGGDDRPMPSPCRSAVSTESVRRCAEAAAWRPGGRRRRRSMCFLFLSRRISSSRESTMPSTRTRVKPGLARPASMTSRCSPLRSLTSGREDQELRALRAAQRSRATICCADCCETGRPQRWQVQPADPRPEHAQVVVDLGDRADGGARVGRWPPSARWRWWGRGPGSSRRAASPSGRGTAGRRRRGSRCSGAGPRRRACRRRASDLPEPETPGEDHELLLRDLDGDVLEVVLAGAR